MPQNIKKPSDLYELGNSWSLIQTYGVKKNSKKQKTKKLSIKADKEDGRMTISAIKQAL